MEKKLDLIALGNESSKIMIKDFDVVLNNLCSEYESYISSLNNMQTNCLKCLKISTFKIGRFGPYMSCPDHTIPVVVHCFDKLKLRIRFAFRNAQILTECKDCKVVLKKKYLVPNTKKVFVLYCFDCKKTTALKPNEASEINRIFFENNALLIK